MKVDLTIYRILKIKTNLIVALRPYLSGELMVAQAETPKKKSRKSIPENKKYKKRAKPDEEEEDQQNEIIEFVEEEEEEEAEIEVVAPGGHLSSGVLTSEQNKIRENIAKTKLVRKGQLTISSAHLFYSQAAGGPRIGKKAFRN